MTSIRDGLPGDLESVLALDTALFGDDGWSRASVEAELVRDDCTGAVLLATVDGEVVGFAVLRIGADSADLLRVGVDLAFQRGGVGSALLAAVAAMAVGAGGGRLLLEVARDNAAALGLYTRLGFVVRAVRPRYYAGGADAVVMELTLSGDRVDEQGDG